MPEIVPIAAYLAGDAPRPLSGLTLLAVEDSRYACEALRLLCHHSGARLRRADTLAAAYRHLRVYRPDVLIVDLGLPDGPGEELIAALARGTSRPRVILGTSGDALLAPAALVAGADGFLEKPIPGVEAFQRAILAHLPAEPGPERRPMAEPEMEPDPIALREDLAMAEGILATGPDARARDYVVRFLRGVAISAQDAQLAEAAAGFGSRRPGGREADLSRLARLLRDRIDRGAPVWTRGRADGPGSLRP
ncbi:MAG: response regulator [Paracoccaceae bacterium]|nr:response regulator [Paracoccaceae bacterium]MDE3240262.1 response regulator [Paracoccaceae bacterium]